VAADSAATENKGLALLTKRPRVYRTIRSGAFLAPSRLTPPERRSTDAVLTNRNGTRSKRTGKPCRGAAMPNGRCRLHGGKSTGPRTPEGLERSRRANWKHGHFSRGAKAERSRVRAAILALRDLRYSI
jgi:hypothetical protein